MATLLTTTTCFEICLPNSIYVLWPRSHGKLIARPRLPLCSLQPTSLPPQQVLSIITTCKSKAALGFTTSLTNWTEWGCVLMAFLFIGTQLRGPLSETRQVKASGRRHSPTWKPPGVLVPTKLLPATHLQVGPSLQYVTRSLV